MTGTSLSKSARARALGVARSTLYYEKKKNAEDWNLKQEIEAVLREFPSYGFRRVAQHLKLNKKKVQRVMRLFGVKAYRRRGRRWKKPKKQAVVYPNLLMTATPSFPHHAWVADFTYLAFHGRFVYVATVMDVFTRDIVGVSVATTHGSILVIQALCAALHHHPRPCIFHSDNGVEYNAITFREMLVNCNIQISRSKKGCPWENGYQESFYDKFKVELGDPNRFRLLGELVAEIYRTIHIYNTARIHSALKMAPRQFALLHAAATMRTTALE
jgi:transposase InsO family protein